MNYKIEITSILGRKGQIVELPDNNQTRERLDKGIISVTEQYQPTEKKKVSFKKKKSD